MHGAALHYSLWYEDNVGDSSGPLGDTLRTKFISFMGLKLFQIHIKDLSMPLPCIIYSATAHNKSSSFPDFIFHELTWLLPGLKRFGILIFNSLPLTEALFFLSFHISRRSPQKKEELGSPPSTVPFLKAAMGGWPRKCHTLSPSVNRISHSLLSHFFASRNRCSTAALSKHWS